MIAVHNEFPYKSVYNGSCFLKRIYHTFLRKNELLLKKRTQGEHILTDDETGFKCTAFRSFKSMISQFRQYFDKYWIANACIDLTTDFSWTCHAQFLHYKPN